MIDGPSLLSYRDEVDPEAQLDAEEWIASAIFERIRDERGADAEEMVAELGRVILLEILRRFRPDLLEEIRPASDELVTRAALVAQTPRQYAAGIAAVVKHRGGSIRVRDAGVDPCGRSHMDSGDAPLSCQDWWDQLLTELAARSLAMDVINGKDHYLVFKAIGAGS